MIVFSSGDLQTWEAEAKVYRDKSTPVSIMESRVITWHHCEVWIVHVSSSSQNLLFLEVPPYREPNIYHPVKVNFHVLNGKKHCSQAPHFTYTPLSGEIFNLHVNKWHHVCAVCPVSMTSLPVQCHRLRPSLWRITITPSWVVLSVLLWGCLRPHAVWPAAVCCPAGTLTRACTPLPTFNTRPHTTSWSTRCRGAPRVGLRVCRPHAARPRCLSLGQTSTRTPQ